MSLHVTPGSGEEKSSLPDHTPKRRLGPDTAAETAAPNKPSIVLYIHIAWVHAFNHWWKSEQVVCMIV